MGYTSGLNEKTGYFEHVPNKWYRNSPTMSAENAGKEATAKYGKNPVAATVGDLSPKPTKDMIDGWKAQLREDALKEENKDDPRYKLRDQNKDFYAYTTKSGLPCFQATAAWQFTRDTGMQATAADIGVGNGGKGTLYGMFYNRLDEGDVVFVGAPAWPSDFDMFPPGVRVVEIPTKDGLLRAEDIQQALKHYPNPSVIMLNAPNNPTGANYTPEEREALFAAVAAGTTDTLVVDDNPYGKLVLGTESYDSHKVLQRGDQEKALFDAGRVAVVRTISKEYGLAGGRCGYVVTKERSVKNEPDRPAETSRKPILDALGAWNQNPGGGISADALELGQAAMIYGDKFIEKTVGELTTKSEMLYEGVQKLGAAGVKMNKSAGAMYGFVDFRGLKGMVVPPQMSETGEAYTINTPADKDRFLVNVAEICSVPGVPFHAPGQQPDQWGNRITFALNMPELERLVQNLQRIKTLKLAQNMGITPGGIH